MTKHTRSPYTCPRCNYQVDVKSSIRTHLYKLKKPCAARTIEQDIELTDEIKEYILNNRIYQHISTQIVPNIQQIQNIHNIQNIVVNMNDIDKIKLLLDYNGKTLIGYGDQLELDHAKTIQKLRENNFRNRFRIEPDSFLDIIDQSVSGNKSETMNLLFNPSLNKILMFQDDEWETYLVEPGLKKVITRNRDYYLEYYEYFLLQNYFDLNVNAQLRNNYHNQLKEYFKFLSYFDVLPSSYQDFSGELKTNQDILPKFQNDNEYYLSEFCFQLQKNEKISLKQPDINQMRRKVIDIIKCNSLHNQKTLNKNIVNLVNMDPEFKQKLIQQIDNEVGAPPPLKPPFLDVRQFSPNSLSSSGQFSPTSLSYARQIAPELT